MYNVYNCNLLIYKEKDLSKLYSLLKPLSNFMVINYKWNGGKIIKENGIIRYEYFDEQTILPLDATLIICVLNAYKKRKLENINK